MEGFLIFLLIIGAVFFLSILKQINEYERGILFTMGRYSGILTPGWKPVIPVFQSYTKVDIRTKAVDLSNQEAMTKDNISIKVSAIIYYKIEDASKAILEVENFYYAISNLAQTTMRNVVGEAEMDYLLGERDQVAKKIQNIIAPQAQNWGIQVLSIELKDVILPDNMVRTMAKQAEAEREKRANIINSEGEVIAAKNLSAAAKLMAETPGALHLRTLNAINDLSSDETNTVVFAVPMEVLRAFDGFAKSFEKKN
ncbi:slipin family protein [Patescibacteria group bacterium]|nr:slipin family protein [Patescibacteria group bacterium]